MKRLLKISGSYLLMLLFPVAIFFAMYIIFPNVTFTNVRSIFNNSLYPTILACGLLFNFTCGNWDFSVGAQSIIASIMAGNLSMRLGMGIPGVILFSLLTGIVTGLISGGLYYLTRIPTIIVSVGLLYVFECLGAIVFGGSGANLSDTNYIVLNKFPLNLIYTLIALLLAYFLLYRSKFGCHVRAVGSDVNIAMTNGVKAFKIKAMCLLLCGVFAGIYGAAYLLSTGVVYAQTNMATMSTVFTAMMGCLVGMAVSFGRNNLIVSVWVGSVIMQEIKVFLLAANVLTAYCDLIIAIFVLILMTFVANPQFWDKAKALFHWKKRAA